MASLQACMSISPFLSLHRPCDEALRWTGRQLKQAGLHVVQTFDLQAARAGLHNCACPHHGTDECDCQMLVVLVYGKAEEPVTLILHGNDGQTWFSIAENPRQKLETELTMEIRQVLEKIPVLLSQAS